MGAIDISLSLLSLTVSKCLCLSLGLSLCSLGLLVSHSLPSAAVSVCLSLVDLQSTHVACRCFLGCLGLFVSPLSPSLSLSLSSLPSVSLPPSPSLSLCLSPFSLCPLAFLSYACFACCVMRYLALVCSISLVSLCLRLFSLAFVSLCLFPLLL